MEARVLVCVIALVCLCAIVNAQVASICRPKERFLACGCPKTCNDPAPSCAGSCRMGCYCEEGQVRNEEGYCVKLADCPPNKLALTLDTTEPRPNNGACPPDEEYRFCEPCIKSCDNPNPICPAQCTRGCFCVDGLLRNDRGRCVKPEECQNTTASGNSYQEYQMTCNAHQVFKQCETCERTCSNPDPRCPTPCVTGCFCDPGYVKAPNGLCVKLEDCPKAETSIGEARLYSPMDMIMDGSPTVEDCAPDEEYFFCGWCEPSCSHPRPLCSYKMCTTGCLCRPPLLRHHSGRCVEEKDCFPQKCKDNNEEFGCRYGCEPRCDTQRSCVLRPRKCIVGCHCKLGFYRQSSTGLCVTQNNCINNTLIHTSITQKNSIDNILKSSIKTT